MWNKKKSGSSDKKHSRPGIHIQWTRRGCAAALCGICCGSLYTKRPAGRIIAVPDFWPCCVPVPDYIMELWDTGGRTYRLFCGLAAG